MLISELIQKNKFIVKLDMSLLIRLFEFAREDAKSDIDIHNMVEQLEKKSTSKSVLDMSDYAFLTQKIKKE
jgi:hypothetical protein